MENKSALQVIRHITNAQLPSVLDYADEVKKLHRAKKNAEARKLRLLMRINQLLIAEGINEN